MQDVARRGGQRQQVIERPVVRDRREQRADEPAGQRRGHRRRMGVEERRIRWAAESRGPRGGAFPARPRDHGRGSFQRCLTQESPRLTHAQRSTHNQIEQHSQAADAELRSDLQEHVVALAPRLLASLAGSSS